MSTNIIANFEAALARHMPSDDGGHGHDVSTFLSGLSGPSLAPSTAPDGRSALDSYSGITGTMGEVEKTARSTNADIALRTRELAQAWASLEALARTGACLSREVEILNRDLRATGHQGEPVVSSEPIPSLDSIAAGLPASLRAALGR